MVSATKQRRITEEQDRAERHAKTWIPKADVLVKWINSMGGVSARMRTNLDLQRVKELLDQHSANPDLISLEITLRNEPKKKEE